MSRVRCAMSGMPSIRVLLLPKSSIEGVDRRLTQIAATLLRCGERRDPVNRGTNRGTTKTSSREAYGAQNRLQIPSWLENHPKPASETRILRHKPD
jgi:hypothetical protein